ncbi:DNA-binding protein [Caballeronia grimmiae]|uniref:DNA-binding protein n=1 Tax=Caballeronia grimmiae TaxID=1071679 RepID=A0A069P623_9BURK|nr:DNA-binding protein [Caballeronia grimmiae]KDR35354.1 DNA-binding protein [Caballeronia grimmiae]GGD84601.1 DNA-binding protein [Caballeronia grimmiae]
MDTQLRDTLRQELDVMRNAGARRQELSHHACKRLFFDLGLRPSVTTVRELTQTGSASDIPRDIESFWETVRSTLHVRVEAGEIPDALRQRAGELLAELFVEARRHADAALSADRAKVDVSVVAAQAATRDAEIRCQAIEQAQRRAELRAEAAVAQIASLEAELKASRARESHVQNDLRDVVMRLEAENKALSERIAREQADAARLRDRIDELQSELRHNTEHYAQQIKDAVKDAERRVKPMLVELDSLRGMAATYQTKVREAGQKEFDFLQQISAAQTRANRLESQVREQSNEIDALTRERDAHRVRVGMSAELGGLIASLALDGRLTAAEIETLGTQVDAYVAAPLDCPACESAEPELQRHEDEFELSCPNCERSSGAVASKLAAVQAFLKTAAVRA